MSDNTPQEEIPEKLRCGPGSKRWQRILYQLNKPEIGGGYAPLFLRLKPNPVPYLNSFYIKGYDFFFDPYFTNGEIITSLRHLAGHFYMEHESRGHGKEKSVWVDSTCAEIVEMDKTTFAKIETSNPKIFQYDKPAWVEGVDPRERIPDIPEKEIAEVLYRFLMEEGKEEYQQQQMSISMQGASSKDKDNLKGEGQSQDSQMESQEMESSEAEGQEQQNQGQEKQGQEKQGQGKQTGTGQEQQNNQPQTLNQFLKNKHGHTPCHFQDSVIGVSTEDRNKVREEITREIEEIVASNPGFISDNILRKIEEKKKPVVIPWKHWLTKRFRETKGYLDTSFFPRPKIRYYDNNTIMRKRTQKGIPELLIVVDSSGSMDQKILNEALRIAKSAMRHGVDPIIAAGDTDLSFMGNYAQAVKNIKGGGGTDMGKVVWDAFKKAKKKRHAPALIFLITDAETPWPEKFPAHMIIMVVNRNKNVINSIPKKYKASVYYLDPSLEKDTVNVIDF